MNLDQLTAHDKKAFEQWYQENLSLLGTIVSQKQFAKFGYMTATVKKNIELVRVSNENDKFLMLLAECRDAAMADGEWYDTSLRSESIGTPEAVPEVVKEKIEMMKKGDFR